MGLHHSPKIVTDGLVMYLDAANPKSYSGTGTTWFDISGNESNSTLQNGVLFDSTNKHFSFDGITDQSTISVTGLNGVATIEMWMKLKTDNGFPFSWNTYSIVYSTGIGIGFSTDNSDFYSTNTTEISPYIDNWTHWIFEMRSDVSYANNKIYANKNLLSFSQTIGSENASNRNFNGGNGVLMNSSIYNDSSFADCSVVKIYNKILTTEEISHNFNSLRGRYGV